MTPEQMVIRSNLSRLISAAQANADVNAVAELVERQVPAAMLDTVLAEADPVAYLAGFHEGVAAYRPWFERLLDALTEDEAETAEDSPIET